ncbi:MAG TPA: hydrogen gas-evolving membrane-bound hydrogenase subunit E [Myxococcaceae bacterium]|nr:hydrogen gas-evolving membrane-bound hydrogenase subunit E [Myxococcaceae bacterium]
MPLGPLILSGFLAALAAPWLHRALPRRSAAAVSLFLLALFLSFARRLPEISSGAVSLVRYGELPRLGLALDFRLDGLSLLFALLITGIGTGVALYSGRYLHGHPGLGRFYFFLLAFMASMLGLVLADNLLALFIFWELTSLASYALIGFEHQRPAARKAALQGLLVTIAGGQALLVGLLLVGMMAGAEGFSLTTLATRREVLHAHPLYLPALVLVLLGAFTKSAQLPFHSWLPGAMEAPTPVSAYLHSATLVKAGVYLLLRLFPAIGGTPAWEVALVGVGGATMLWCGWLALVQEDLKRVLAYATLGVLGTLVLLVGLGTPAALRAALVFLVAHALYKGGLFLVAGSVDHEAGTRRVAALSGLGWRMPLTAAAALMAALAMAGIAPALGFIAKEGVYEAGLENPFLLSAAMVLGFIPTVAVAGIAGVRPFLGPVTRTPLEPHEAPASLWLGPVALGILGVVLGLVPGALGPLLGDAVAAVATGDPRRPLELKLWHGFTLPLALSAVSLTGGLAVYAAREPLRRLYVRLPGTRLPPAWGFSAALEGLKKVAALQTRVLQDGYLRHYLLIIWVVTLGLVGLTLLTKARWWLLPPDWGEVYFAEVVVAALVVLAAVAAARAESRLAAVAAMGVVGFGVALLFLFFGAPDLALTQSVVEALTVVVFALVLLRLPRYRPSRPLRPGLLRDLLLSLTGGGLMTGLVLLASTAPPHPHVSDYFVEHSVEAAHGHNIVNVILTDFRALDTLGETTVLAVAAIGVHAILKLRPRKEEEP